MQSGKTSLIVGGSRGIGLALAHELAAHGHDLILVARDGARLAAAAAEVIGRHGVRVETLALDAASAAAPAAIAQAAATGGRRLTAVVIGTGAWLAGETGDVETGDLVRLLATNVVAPHATIKALLPVLAPGGRVMLVGSLAGMMPIPGIAAYSASKAALHHVAMGWRHELASDGISLSLLAPGVVRTEFVPRGEGVEKPWRWILDLAASSPETVARAGFAGMMSGTGVIVPGLVWRLIWLGTRILPDRLVMPLVGRALLPAPAAGPSARASKASQAT
jgi:hypothetical protein